MSKTIKENERQLLNTGDVLVFAFGAMIGWGWVVLSGQWIVTGGIIGTAIGFLIGGFISYRSSVYFSEFLHRKNVYDFGSGHLHQLDISISHHGSSGYGYESCWHKDCR